MIIAVGILWTKRVQMSCRKPVVGDGKENCGNITLNLNLFTNLAQYFFYFHVYLV